MNRPALALLAALAAAAPAAAQPAWTTEQTDVRVPLRDGQWLAADLWLPKAPGRYPTVLIQTPYNKRSFGAAFPGIEKRQAWVDREAYAYLIVDWRGFFGSKAAAVARPDRGLDGHDTVEWIARQTWSDGKVGTWGGSALGKQQFDTARKKPPHLVCAVPSIAAMGQDYRAYYPGGVLLESHVQTLDRLGFGVSRLVLASPHPHQLAWAIARRASYAPEQIEVPMLLVTGWWDHFPGLVIETFQDLVRQGGEATRAHSRLLIGPWDHVSVGKAEQGELVFRGAEREDARVARLFFDYWLRGKKENGWEKEPRVRYWQFGEERWIAAGAWPGVPAQARTWHLDARGRIAPQAPEGESAGTRRLAGDPKNPVPTVGGANLPPLSHGPRRQDGVEKRPDVLVYTTGPLAEPLRLAGSLTVRLWAQADRPDFDLHVRLCHVPAGGGSYLVCDGARRAKLRGARPAPVEPGTPVTLEVVLPPVALTVKKGEELRLVVSGSNWPRHERNPHTGDDHWDAAKAQDVEVTLHHGGERASTVTLPVVGP